MSKYQKKFKIPYYSTDKNKVLTPVWILSYLSEFAGEHADEIGFSLEKIKTRNYGWMLNRWIVRINKYPKAKENIIVETWISNINKFYAYREFIIYDEKKNIIGEVSTIWIFLDMNKKRPERIPKEFIEKVNPNDKTLFKDLYKFNKDIISEKNLKVEIRRSDIDYNNHVNNTRYLSWIIETIPKEIYKSYKLDKFEILYKKEITSLDYITLGIIEMERTKNKIKYYHEIVDKDKKEIHSLGITEWIL